MRTAPSLLAILFYAAPLAAMAAEPAPAVGPVIEFSVDAQRPAPNDQVIAIMYVEQAGADAAALARGVNRAVTAAMETARAHPSVKLQSAGTSTWPNYGKGSGTRIEGWRMRSELRLESRDVAAMSELIGKLQSSLGLAQVTLQPAPDTRRAAADEATIDAIRAFERKAGVVASALGKRYRIRQLNLGESGAPPAYARMRMSATMAEAAPAPLEGGESLVSVTASGSIELTD